MLSKATIQTGRKHISVLPLSYLKTDIKTDLYFKKPDRSHLKRKAKAKRTNFFPSSGTQDRCKPSSEPNLISQPRPMCGIYQRRLRQSQLDKK